MKFLPTANAAFLLVGAASFATAEAAQTESVIYNFPYPTGAYSRIYEDATGALYGSEYLRPLGFGSIYQLTERKGVWTKHQIFEFDGSDGKKPLGGLIQDSSGTLYGTTEEGGTSDLGTVFTLTPPGGGVWSESVILDLNGGTGELPESNLLVGKTGAIFGTASSGGSAYCGTVFELAQSGGNWTETTLHTFQGGSDGCGPLGGLHLGAAEGTMYGTTDSGGQNNQGTVFLIKEVHGQWEEEVVYQFAGGGYGAEPKDIDVDANENIYGVAYQGGGAGNYGLLFELADQGTWQEAVIHDFEGSDGSSPVGVHFDRTNNTLYGTTAYGGAHDDGTVFQFVGSGKSWTETTLHSFGDGAHDGTNPQSRPIVDKASGVLYGTTLGGGRNDGGTAWMVTP